MLKHGVRVTTATTGIGAVTVTAVPGMSTIASRFAVGAIMDYVILDDNGNKEWGLGTVGASNTLARTTITGTLVGTTYTAGGSPITLSGSATVTSTQHEGSAAIAATSVANYAALPITGITGVIYVALDTGYTYRWNGSVYVGFSTYSGLTQSLQSGSYVSDLFDRSDRSLQGDYSLNGTAWSLTGAGVGSSSITGGVFVNTVPANAVYAYQIGTTSIKRISGSFSFVLAGSGTNDLTQSVLTLIADSATDVANSLHLNFGPTAWQLTKRIGGVPTVLAGGNYNLLNDGTIYKFAMQIDTVAHTVQVVLPDGTLSAVITDAAIGSTITPINGAIEIYAASPNALVGRWHGFSMGNSVGEKLRPFFDAAPMSEITWARGVYGFKRSRNTVTVLDSTTGWYRILTESSHYSNLIVGRVKITAIDPYRMQVLDLIVSASNSPQANVVVKSSSLETPANGNVISQVRIGANSGAPYNCALDVYIPNANSFPGLILAIDVEGYSTFVSLPVSAAAALPTSTVLVVSTGFSDAIEAATRAAADALLTPLAQKGAANGVATLDSGAKLPVAQNTGRFTDVSATFVALGTMTNSSGVASGILVDAGGGVLPGALQNPAARVGLALTGTPIAVTNLVTAPSDFSSAAWDSVSVGVAVSSNFLRFSGASQIAAQLGKTLTAGKIYLMVAEARSLSVIDNTKTVMYPSLNLDIYSGALAIDLQTLDYSTSLSTTGTVSLRPVMGYHFARFEAPVTAANYRIGIKDVMLNNQACSVEVAFIGLYDITGLTGVVYDATANKYFNVGNNVNFIGDSMGLHLYQVRDTLGLAVTNINGSFSLTGSQTNGSAVITGISNTSNLTVGYAFAGTGIPSGVKILSVDSSTQVTLTANANTTIASNYYTTNFYGSGKNTTPISAAVVASSAAIRANNSIIWMGHNNPPAAAIPTSLAQTKTDFIALTNSLTGDFRILTLDYNSTQINPRTTSADYIDQLNDWLIAYYGSKVIDIRIPLAANSNGSAADILNVQWHQTPASLLSDGLHVNDRGSDVVADAIYANLGKSWS